MFNRAFPKPTKTNRFLFHLAEIKDRKSIRKYGLLASEKSCINFPCVFAHNDDFPKNIWFPFCHPDYYFLTGHDVNSNSPFFHYDFWRIDTQKLDKVWFIDEALSFEVKYYQLKHNIYVFCKGDISPDALTLFRFQDEFTYEYSGNGTMHYRGLSTFREHIF